MDNGANVHVINFVHDLFMIKNHNFKSKLITYGNRRQSAS